MPSLVSNFIIQPVLRQARRFSTGFATGDPPAVHHHRTRSDAEGRLAADDAAAELENDGNGTGDGRIQGPRRSVTQLPAPAPRTSSPREEPAGTGAAAEQSIQPPTRPETSGSGTAGTPGLGWIEDVNRGAPLPEDDGNGELRQKILAIQALDVAQPTKAQLVHQLLMEGYNKSRLGQAPPRSPSLNPESPSSRSVQDRREAEPSGPLQQALKFLNPLVDMNGPLDLPLTEDDLRKTYVPPGAAGLGDDFASQVEKMRIEDHGQPVLGCEHYRRNVKMQCAACEKWYTCRFCHDAVEDHTLPRKDTKHMLCMLCGCAQKASDTCVGCGESASYYFCGVCKLWNDDPNKAIYHCNDCGLCRVGQGLGKDFFHCKKCMACISISMLTGHKCIERSIDCDCPICGEYMFNSPRPVIFMQCGHSIHRRCFEQHTQSSYKCPLCNKSCINMDAKFRSYDMAILTQPMPPEYRDARAIVSCNDCSAKSQTSYHWLGLKCSLCSSYNTIQLQLLNMPGREDEGGSRSQPGTGRIPSSRRLSELAGEALPDIATLARQLRRRARGSERPESPSIFGRLFVPRSGADAVVMSTSAPAAAPSISIFSSSSRAAARERLSSSAAEEEGVAVASSPPSIRQNLVVGVGVEDLDLDLDSSEEEDGDSEEEMQIFDFWGRSVASGDEAGRVVREDADKEEEEEEESSSSESDAGEDEEEDEEEEIVLFGHR